MVMIADDLRKWLLLLFLMTGQVKEVVKLEPPSLLGRVIRLTVKTAFWGECFFLFSTGYTFENLFLLTSYHKEKLMISTQVVAFMEHTGLLVALSQDYFLSARRQYRIPTRFPGPRKTITKYNQFIIEALATSSLCWPALCLMLPHNP